MDCKSIYKCYAALFVSMKKILIQLPEGLKQKAVEYAKKYEKEGCTVYISSEPCFGACDIPVHEAKTLGCDKIVHFGHAKFIDVKEINVEYVPVYENVQNISDLMQTALKKGLDKYNDIGIITNISHVKQIDEIKSILEKYGKNVHTANGSSTCPYRSQVLGCDVTALTKIKKNIDCLVYFGGGKFHALAPGVIDDNYSLPTLWINPFSTQIEWITKDLQRIQKQRRMSAVKALEAKVYGILVSTKVGQYNMEYAIKLLKMIEKYDKKGIIIVGNTFDFNTLGYNFMEVDAFINTACPRLVDDQNKMNKPIVNAKELVQLLEK